MLAARFELTLMSHQKKTFFTPYLFRFFLHKLTQNAYFIMHSYGLKFDENDPFKREKIKNNRYFSKKTLISPKFFIRICLLVLSKGNRNNPRNLSDKSPWSENRSVEWSSSKMRTNKSMTQNMLCSLASACDNILFFWCHEWIQGGQFILCTKF